MRKLAKRQIAFAGLIASFQEADFARALQEGLGVIRFAHGDAAGAGNTSGGVIRLNKCRARSFPDRPE